jgi:hypothetical protein
MSIARAMLDAIRITKLKGDARRAYEKYNRILDRFDCGASFAEEISPELYKAKTDFNKAMDSLAKLDTNAPKFRL